MQAGSAALSLAGLCAASRIMMNTPLMTMMIAPMIVQITGLSPHSIQPRAAAHTSAVVVKRCDVCC